MGTRKHSAKSVNDHPTLNMKKGFIKSTTIFNQQHEYLKLKHKSTKSHYKVKFLKINLLSITLSETEMTKEKHVHKFTLILHSNV
jgi:hypothetical protein